MRQKVSIQGTVDYRIYGENGELKHEVVGIKNFITSTGLTFPATYAYADCFRFISLGTGLNQNSISGSFGGTTGLYSGIKEFLYIGSRTSFSDETTADYENPGCGFSESIGQVTLSRAWKIPSGTGTFDNNYNFNEIMLSPGRPTGTSLQCGCQGGDTSNGGVDASIVADYYDSIGTSICKGNKAFSRIALANPITVNTRDFLVVNYNLNLLYDSGVDTFATTIVNNNFSPYWTGKITGASNIIHHGIKLINNGGNTDLSTSRNQVSPNGESYTWTSEYGESYIPLWGAPLEPSCLASNLIAYMSTDNLQFLVNQISGGALDSTLWQPYNPTGYTLSSGLKSFIANPSVTIDSRYFNIRTSLSNGFWPEQTGVFAEINSSPANTNYILHSSSNKTSNPLAYVPSGRSRTILYPFVFTNLNSFNWINGTSPTPLCRSMIINYSDTTAIGNSTMYPFLDLLFTGTAREGLVPTGSDTSYGTPSNDYYPLGNGGDLTISFALTWSAPCPNNVIGC